MSMFIFPRKLSISKYLRVLAKGLLRHLNEETTKDYPDIYAMIARYFDRSYLISANGSENGSENDDEKFNRINRFFCWIERIESFCVEIQTVLQCNHPKSRQLATFTIGILSLTAEWYNENTELMKKELGQLQDNNVSTFFGTIKQENPKIHLQSVSIRLPAVGKKQAFDLSTNRYWQKQANIPAITKKTDLSNQKYCLKYNNQKRGITSGTINQNEEKQNVLKDANYGRINNECIKVKRKNDWTHFLILTFNKSCPRHKRQWLVIKFMDQNDQIACPNTNENVLELSSNLVAVITRCTPKDLCRKVATILGVIIGDDDYDEARLANMKYKLGISTQTSKTDLVSTIVLNLKRGMQLVDVFRSDWIKYCNDKHISIRRVLESYKKLATWDETEDTSSFKEYPKSMSQPNQTKQSIHPNKGFQLSHIDGIMQLHVLNKSYAGIDTRSSTSTNKKDSEYSKPPSKRQARDEMDSDLSDANDTLIHYGWPFKIVSNNN